MGEHSCACLKGTVGEKDVGSDDDTVRGGALGDPVVSFVKAIADDHAFDEWVSENAERRVTDNFYQYGVAQRDFVNLVLHRAGIGINEDLDHHSQRINGARGLA